MRENDLPLKTLPIYKTRAVVINTKDDPLQVLRVQVRVPGWWDNVPDEDLPWAEYQLNDARGRGGRFVPAEVDDWVWVEFPNGDTRYPIITGWCHYAPDGKPNTPHEAWDGEEKIVHIMDRVAQEPKPEPVEYHGSDVIEKYGLVIEINPAGELLITQRSTGTATRITKEGSLTLHIEANQHESVQGNTRIHIVGDKYTLIEGNNEKHIVGNNEELIEGNSDLHIVGNKTEQIDGNIEKNIVGLIKENINGYVEITILGSKTEWVEGFFDQRILGLKREWVENDDERYIYGERIELVMGDSRQQVNENMHVRIFKNLHFQGPKMDFGEMGFLEPSVLGNKLAAAFAALKIEMDMHQHIGNLGAPTSSAMQVKPFELANLLAGGNVYSKKNRNQ